MFVSNYFATLQQYAVFSGRTGRKEFWYFVLAHYVAIFILGFIEGFMGWFPDTDEAVIANFYVLATLLPYLGASVRRLHDVDKSGWYILIPLYNLYLLVLPGTTETNRFGNDGSASGIENKFCAHCGVANTDTANFCKACGKPMTV